MLLVNGFIYIFFYFLLIYIFYEICNKKCGKIVVIYIVVIFMKKYESGKFYDSHNDKIGFDEFKSPIEDDLNDVLKNLS